MLLDRISYTEATSYLNEHLAETASVPPELLLGLSNDMPLQAVEIATSDWFAKRQSFRRLTKVVNQKICLYFIRLNGKRTQL